MPRLAPASVIIEGMRRALVLVTLPTVLLLAACGGPKPAPRHADGCQAVTPEPGHALEVYLSVAREADKRPLCPGMMLTEADALWISVELDTASYVRMVFIAPDGQAGELQRQDEADLTRMAIFRAPEGLLAHAPGEAQLVLVASRDPLETADSSMQLMLDVIRDTGTLVDRDGSLHPPPPGTEPPPDLMHLDASKNLFADFDDKGVAMLTISLRTGQ